MTVNIFQCSYDFRLQQWYELRNKLKNEDIKHISIEVDKWWQKTPLINHYLHYDFMDSWPDPWELIYENTYCTYARGLGMIYTLYLLGIHNIEFVVAKDYNEEEVALVLVDDAKYLLNYWPDTVLNNSLQDFRITRPIKINQILAKVK